MFLLILIVLIICTVIYRRYQHATPSPNIDPRGKYVLITGCDSGFGHQLALELDKQGVHVLAGVYLPDNVPVLGEQLSSSATVMHLDITREEDIDAAFDLVSAKTRTLHALVNNAGVTAGHLIDWTPMDIMRRVMDVNFFGHVAMTKKFLPLLIAQRRSRVVNVCSIFGRVSFSGTAAYSASKNSLKAFSDCLRREMAPWHLHVSIIEPGVMRTPFIDRVGDTIRELWDELPDDVQQRWGENYFQNNRLQSMNSATLVSADNPDRVVEVLLHAVLNSEPRIEYRPGFQAKLLLFCSYVCPAWLMDFLLDLGETAMPAGVQQQLVE